MNTPEQWLATFTRRWHTHPHLSATNDPVGYHSGRMAALALHYWPDCSRELLVACICHDLGESGLGDVPSDAKRDPEMKAALDRLEARRLDALGMSYTVTEADEKRLKFLDHLDAYLWMQHNAPHCASLPAWVEAAEMLVIAGRSLKIHM